MPGSQMSQTHSSEKKEPLFRPNSDRGYSRNLLLITDPSGDYTVNKSAFTRREIQAGAKNWDIGSRFEDRKTGIISIIVASAHTHRLEEEVKDV